jgi:pimeloyl-ACP methyl ester carboxylesterase
LARAIPHAHEMIVPAASHMAPLEDPKLVDAAIRGFLVGAPPIAY